jgi:hypothetical protein
MVYNNILLRNERKKVALSRFQGNTPLPLLSPLNASIRTAKFSQMLSYGLFGIMHKKIDPNEP